MKSFYLTDTGRIREHNEDSVTILKNISGEYLCVVADGMGGHRKGEVASALTVAHLGKRFTESASIGTKIDAVNWLSDNINEINKEILAKGLSLFVFVITDIINSNSEAIVLGDRTDVIAKSYEIKDNIAVMPGVVSRKKQVLPLVEKNM